MYKRKSPSEKDGDFVTEVENLIVCSGYKVQRIVKTFV